MEYPLEVVQERAAERRRLEARLAELEAVLAPILADPIVDDKERGVAWCRVCLKRTNYWQEGDWRPRPPLHEPDCGVLLGPEVA